MDNSEDIQAKFQISTKDNIYTIIKNLREYMYRAKGIENFNELNIFVPEVKEFIERVPILKKENENRLISFMRFQQDYEYKPNFIKKILYEMIKNEQPSFSETDGKLNLDMPFIYFFPSAKYIMGDPKDFECEKSIKPDEGIIDFYFNNIVAYLSKLNKRGEYLKVKNVFDKFYSKEKNAELVQCVDFVVLESENMIPTHAPFYKNLFFQKWIYSALIKVLSELEGRMQLELMESSPRKTYIKKQGIMLNIIKDKFAEYLIQMLEEIIQNKNITLNNLSEKINDYGETYVRNFLNKFNYFCTGIRSGGITVAKDNIEKYKFTLEDVTALKQYKNASALFLHPRTK